MENFKDCAQLLTIKRYSKNTIHTYVGLLRAFDVYIGDAVQIQRMDSKYLLQSIREIIIDKNYAYTTQKQLLSTLKLYSKEVHNKLVNFDTKNPLDFF